MECHLKLRDFDACCMFSDQTGQQEFNCRSKAFIDSILNSPYYDPVMKRWTHPGDTSNTYITYCFSDGRDEKGAAAEELVNTYPFVQPYANEFDLLPLRDPFNKNARQDMFYKPKTVNSFQEQFEKWMAALFWYFTPLPLMVFCSNIFWFSFDFLFISGEKEAGTFPHMYQNSFAEYFLRSRTIIEMFSVFKWYDMFSLRGFDNWWWDAVVLVHAPWWKVVEAFVRLDRGDWYYWTNEANNDIDMNRLWPIEQATNPDDTEYLQNREHGRDCNGNVGQGLYCYCPS